MFHYGFDRVLSAVCFVEEEFGPVDEGEEFFFVRGGDFGVRSDGGGVVVAIGEIHVDCCGGDGTDGGSSWMMGVGELGYVRVGAATD